MPSELDQYVVSTAHWRRTLQTNNRKTYLTIGLFFLIYGLLGVLIDLYMTTSINPGASVSQLLLAFITLKRFPLATCILLGIATLSLCISYLLHDKLMLLGTASHEITPETAHNTTEQQLYHVIEEMKIAAGLRYMPRVFIIDAAYMNAFASGYSEKSAMVAITRGLIAKLNRDELQAVMAHELSHIRHLDIKLTLTASLLANLTIMVLDFFFYQVLLASNREDTTHRSKSSLVTLIMILRYALPVINVFMLLYLSRTRELMADAGAVELMRTNQPLASALLKIQNDHIKNRDTYHAAYRQTTHENVRREAYIYDPTQAGIASIPSISDLFSTHPRLETRLAALGYQKKKDSISML
jgi:heat shock protein HtpX